MDPPNFANDATGNHGNNADTDQSDQWIPDVFPASDIFEPVVRPTRKNTNKPKFPLGFSPFNDQRDPEVDPNAYPPRSRRLFEESIGGASTYIRTRSLSALFLLGRPARNPTVLRALAFAFGILVAPIAFWVAALEFWRHFNGWLHYLFYYIAGTQGYYQRQMKCARVLREGSNSRFTITKQFWYRRGCEGSLDGYDHQDFKTISDGLVSTFMTTWFCWPRSILHFLIWFLVWVVIAGLFHDFLYFIVKYAIWLWERRVWPLVKDIFDWPWLLGFFLTPWVLKVEHFWTAIWAVFLGFEIQAFRPRQGMGQQGGVPVEQLDDLFEPEDEDDGRFPDQEGLDIPEVLRPGLVPRFDPNDVFVPGPPGQGHFAPVAPEMGDRDILEILRPGLVPRFDPNDVFVLGPPEQGPFAPGAPEMGVAVDPDELFLFLRVGGVQQLQPDPGPFEQFEQEQDDFEDEQRPVAEIPVSDSDEEDQGELSVHGSKSNRVSADIQLQGQAQAAPSELISDSNSVPSDLLRDLSSEGSHRGGEDPDPEGTRTDLARWNFGHGDE